MSRFYASIEGGRGNATRQGHSRIAGHIRGWDLGIDVQGEIDENGADVFYVYVTGGSNGAQSSRLLAIIRGADEIVPEIAWRDELIPA